VKHGTELLNTIIPSAGVHVVAAVVDAIRGTKMNAATLGQIETVLSETAPNYEHGVPHKLLGRVIAAVWEGVEPTLQVLN
jgi:hypothetical protein